MTARIKLPMLPRNRSMLMKGLRRRLELSQAGLAKKLGVSKNTVARWERGERTITDQVLTHIQLLQEVCDVKD